MVLFSIKIFNNLRKAIAGRRYPAQLAGGLALGVLLGVIPHGNFLALVVLMGVLCFQVNHAFLAVVAIATAFCATHLDPYSHEVGNYLLTHPTGYAIAKQAWTYPMVPWMEINNTVVLGSFVIGLAAVLPLFMLTYPFFKLFVPAEPVSDDAEAVSLVAEEKTETATKPRRMIQPVVNDETTESRPLRAPRPADFRSPRGTAPAVAATSEPVSIPVDQVLGSEPDFMPIDGPSVPADHPNNQLPTREQMVSVDTRIDVIRMNDYREDNGENVEGEGSSQEPPQNMDEALAFLLQQLRQTQKQRKAAG
ncbi:MAG: TIGR03546 family protein [Planctomycetota bacterium]